MAREKKQVEEEIPEGAPEWMVTFSDCMTLLLTFFVLLLSFSSFSDKQDAKYRQMADSFAQELSFSESKSSNEAVIVIQEPRNSQDKQKGSEQPTKEEGKEDQLKKQSEPEKFRDQKVFLMASDDIFLGRTSRFSVSGRKHLKTMADYFKTLSNRIVITESGPQTATDAGDLGLKRAWAIVDYLTTKQGMDRQLFSISASGTVHNGLMPEADRMLEIVLLERRVYH